MISSLLCLIYIIPNGLCESGNAYLSFYTQKIFIFSVEDGDVIRCEYRTHDSSFQARLHWVYQEDYLGDGLEITGTFVYIYNSMGGVLEPSGWFEIKMKGGSDSRFRFGLINTGESGYIEYDIRNLGEEARITLSWVVGIVSVVSVVSVVSLIGITLYLTKRKKKREIIDVPSVNSE